MQRSATLIFLCIPLATSTMERFTPRWFCHERVAHTQTINALLLPASISAAVFARLYDSTSTISTIMTGEAVAHTIFTGAVWAMKKMGRKAALAHDSEKYENRSKKSKATLGHLVKSEIDYRKDDLLVPADRFGLVPNDVSEWSPQGSWGRTCSKHLNQSIPQEIDLCPEAFVRKEYLFKPKKISSEEPLVIVVTHGTFGSQTPSYYKDYSQFELNTSISPQNYRHIERFATRLGDAQQKQVVLLSFRWSGDLDDGERIMAGKVLAAILNKNFPKAQPFLIGHSHGCNVHRHAAQLLDNDVSMMIHFAPPYRPEKEYAPTGKVLRSVAFISPNDIIARGGQIPEKILLSLVPAVETGVLVAGSYLFPDQTNLSLAAGALIWGGQLLQALPYFMRSSLYAPEESLSGLRIVPAIDGKSLGHSEMADMSRYLWRLWPIMSKTGPGLKKMHATIETDPVSLKLADIEHLPL